MPECRAVLPGLSEVIVNGAEWVAMKGRSAQLEADWHQHMTWADQVKEVIGKQDRRIAQLEAALREINRHLAGHPHFVTADGLLNNIIAPAWKVARDAMGATSETGAKHE